MKVWKVKGRQKLLYFMRVLYKGDNLHYPAALFAEQGVNLVSRQEKPGLMEYISNEKEY